MGWTLIQFDSWLYVKLWSWTFMQFDSGLYVKWKIAPVLWRLMLTNRGKSPLWSNVCFNNVGAAKCQLISLFIYLAQSVKVFWVDLSRCINTQESWSSGTETLIIMEAYCSKPKLISWLFFCSLLGGFSIRNFCFAFCYTSCLFSL